MTTGFLNTKMSPCSRCCGFLWLFKIQMCVPSPPCVIVCDGNLWSFICAQFECVYVCLCPSFAQMWKTLFVCHLDTLRGRLYKIPACWSNGTVGKATIVVLTMKRLSSMVLRENVPSLFSVPLAFSLLLSHSHVMPIHSSPLPSLSLLPTSPRRYSAFFSPNPFSLSLSHLHPHHFSPNPIFFLTHFARFR